jgi:creatinine amidohydrolase
MLPRHPLRNALLAVVAVWPATTLTAQIRSVLLEDLTWKQAADFLTPQTIVRIPLGAASKEHGPHLKLSNDFLTAEYLTKEVMARTSVVVAPTVNYHFYPMS